MSRRDRASALSERKRTNLKVCPYIKKIGKKWSGEMKARMFSPFLALVLAGVVAPPTLSQSLFVKALGPWGTLYVNYKGYSVVEISDGGLVVTGSTRRSGDWGFPELLLAKFDASGNHLWTKELGESNESEYGMSMVTVSDGGLVLTGYTTSYGTGDQDLLLAKFDGSGNHLWTKTLGVADYDRGYSVVEVSDGALVVTGHTRIYTPRHYDLLLAKFDGSGNHLWTRTLGGTDDDYGYSVVETSEGGLVCHRTH